MAEACCQKKAEDLKGLAQRQAKVLWLVLVLNLVMFFVEFGAGLISESLALTGDSLDMLGDAIAYGSSIFVLGGTLAQKARSSQLKALLMIALGLFVAGQAIYRVFFQLDPVAEVMGIIGLVALIVNLVCLMVLTRHKDDDLNLRSVWLCSRNDIIANTSVLGAAFFVAWSGSPWPDLIVGAGIATLFLRSAFSVLAEAKQELTLSQA